MKETYAEERSLPERETPKGHISREGDCRQDSQALKPEGDGVRMLVLRFNFILKHAVDLAPKLGTNK
ncbi:hypothetical protein OPS25_02360 [Alteromonas ponticola]|uniref:Uncharacterized protein n=1 Tax=Alteromonas aquimaris TaxID=2998417 RepID=A0ABT3P3L8_9ALTE|nr:hypothetical protein [Alteromonas aquimaris]MCW8107343.1 hypothetical protein [Alteromonas aquimaris]